MADNQDKEMTPEERMAWLRERGVKIETPEERQAAHQTSALPEAGHGEEIRYVLVPADTSRPLKELSFRPTSQGGDLLVEHLKTAFAGTSNQVDISLLQQQAPTLLGGSETPASVSDEALRQVASQASVETFALVHAMPSNNFTGINIYLDEVGMLKRLPLNTRAGEYAERAGFSPAPTFYSDVFLGRVQHKPTLHNVSFCLGVDTAMNAPWLQAAAQQNLDYQTEMNQMTGRTDTQPAVAGSEGKAKLEEGFSWTQTEEELEICVALPPEAQAKEVQVKFKPRSVQVLYQKDERLVLQLFERVDVDASTWTIDRATSPPQLVISMEKVEEALWPRIEN